ncbi:MAG: glycogen synthase [Proteobacteria bacterium]|nr:glycogen synthase [Pseudomonadota bacterium]
MKLLLASSEAVPYIKTGGLGDIVGTLAKIMSERGHRVCLVLPLYREIDRSQYHLKPVVSSMDVRMGNTTLLCRVWRSRRSSKLDVYFIEYNRFFDRSSLYGDGNVSYLDNGARFAFFSKAVLELAIRLNFQPDVVHTHDWHTALIPYYLKSWNWNGGFFKKTASVLSIHNIGYQGQSDLSFGPFIGLNWMQSREDEFESLGGLNLLKGGIFYSDQITTVSPTYAREILSEPGGNGLSRFLIRRKGDVTGILNGIDRQEWNAKIDPYIPANYDVDDMAGKAVCKEALQKRFRLEVDRNIPVFGFVGRMTSQKGLDLLKDCIPKILSWKMQLVLLGDGDPYYTDFFGSLPKKYRFQAGTTIGFQPPLAHQIEAGADFFIMPSLYEPCGLNQMYSMVYGTLPVVRATGGLNDTVENFEAGRNSGTGFVFYDISSEALKNTLGWALDVWYNNRKAYDTMQERAMGKDFSWDKAIVEYENVYWKAQRKKVDWH